MLFSIKLWIFFILSIFTAMKLKVILIYMPELKWRMNIDVPLNSYEKMHIIPTNFLSIRMHQDGSASLQIKFKMFRIHFRRRTLAAFSIPYLIGVGTLRQKNSLDQPRHSSRGFFLLWPKKNCLMSHAADALAQHNSSLYLKHLMTAEWVCAKQANQQNLYRTSTKNLPNLYQNSTEP